MTEIAFRGLTKYYDEVPAVENMNLTLEAGKIFSLLGPSGCGKTTTLRMIAGLIDPTDGDILFNGESVIHIPPERRRIGMVFQQYVLFPHMTVEENVGFGLRMQGMKKREWKPKVDEVLDLVQLGGYNKRFPKQLSGGQQQRVAVARAVVIDPVVLLLDEPLSNLDAKLREDMREFLSGLQRRLNITTVFVTHDQTEAIELSDTMAVMFKGRVQQVGAPEEVFSRPANRSVAQFMGSTNVVAGHVKKQSDASVEVTAPFGELFVQPGSGLPGDIEDEVMLTIRAEHIAVTSKSAGSGQGRNRFSGRIAGAVFKGGLIHYRVDVDGEELHVIDRSDRQFVPGAEVNVLLPPEKLWIMERGADHVEGSSPESLVDSDASTAQRM